MANMSYCRFRNTAQALQDCLTALDPYENEYEIDGEELRAGIRMFENFLGYCQDIGLIDEYDGDGITRYFEETNATIRESKGNE